MAERRTHWENTWQSGNPETKSWFQDSPGLSLELIRNSGMKPDSGLIDIGGGASRLVDRLLESGFEDLTVLDISAAALQLSQQRLGRQADKIAWIVADITGFNPDRQWSCWHDRAVYHFLTQRKDRQAYRRALLAGLEKGGSLILSAFAEDGPRKCSGLEVRRYSAERMSGEFSPEFKLVESRRESHQTPMGTTQQFGYYRFLRME